MTRAGIGAATGYITSNIQLNNCDSNNNNGYSDNSDNSIPTRPRHPQLNYKASFPVLECPLSDTASEGRKDGA